MKIVKVISGVVFSIGFVIVLGAVGSSDIDTISFGELVSRVTLGGVLIGLASIGFQLGGKKYGKYRR